MKEVVDFDNKFNEFSIQEKTKYIENLLKINNLQEVINSLIYNNDALESLFIIDSISKKTKFKNKYNISNNEIKSMMINCLIKQNKTKYLDEYLNSISKNELKSLIKYEIKNKTPFSKLKICKDLYKKYLKNNNNKKIVNDLSKEKVAKKTTRKTKSVEKKSSKIKKILKKEIKGKKTKWSIGITVSIIIFAFLYIYIGYLYSIILFYNNHVYPNIYLNDKLIEGKSHDELTEYLDKISGNLNSIVKFKNSNDEYEFKYSDIGILVNTDEIKENIIDYYANLNGFEKIIKIFKADKLSYEIEYKIDKNKYMIFLEDLKSKVNVSKKEEILTLSNGNIKYQKGVNGFTLDTTNLDKSIISKIDSDDNVIELNGHVDIVDNQLSKINSKVASYTTYYNESQGRAKNIKNAVSKLNEKIVYPGETFSFYKAVGPYNSSRGYVFYDKDVGSGVCQVSTTIYNVQLLLNLKTVSRYNHGEMVYYVDYGMDATVYGSSVDYKFKNNTTYPIYIEATAKNGALTVSFWSNSNIIKSGYSYKPRVEKVSYLSYRTYLDTYYNGKFIGTTYLNNSVYSKGK